MNPLHAYKPAALAAAIPAFLLLVGASPATAAVQDPAAGHERHKEHQAQDGKVQSLEDQIAELRAQVARLEAALESGHRAQTEPPSPSDQNGGSASDAPGMGQMGGMDMAAMDADTQDGTAADAQGGMGKGMGKGGMMRGKGPMRGKAMQSMAPKSSNTQDPMGTAGMDKSEMKRMRMMGRMGAEDAAEPVAMISALPGFPGASHIYHIGASGYFLDYAPLVNLTKKQRRDLARIQEESMLQQAGFDRRLDQAEQELWVLTSAGEPDAQAVRDKVYEIAGFDAEQRLAFIQSVGAAAEVLTLKQRRDLVGDLEDSFPEMESDSDPDMDHNR